MQGQHRNADDVSKILPILTAAAMGLAASAALAAPAALTPAALTDVKAGVDAWANGNYDTAIGVWRPLADKGDADAMFNLAQAYKLGRGVPLDLTKAEDLYGKAAAKGHVQAGDAYGLLLFQRGERQRALPYIEGSAARGDPRAQYILGVAHFNGDIVKKDWVRAYALTSLARQAGLPQATTALTQMDSYIPLADRQKSVVLAQQIAGQAQANRQRLGAAAELGTGLAVADKAPARVPEIAEAQKAVTDASRIAATDSPATAGADYAKPRNAPPMAVPRPPLAAATPPKVAAAPVAPKAAAPKPATKPEPKPEPKPAPKPAPAVASGPWRVQLGAFGVAGNAEALWTRIKGRPELAGHPRALVPAGRLTKLQATGYASKAEADAACARLTAGGIGCLPSRD